jgi:spore coat protein CotF
MKDMTEKDLLIDLLNQEKELISSCAHMINEASCPNLRKLLAGQFTQACQDEYQVFDQMRQKVLLRTKGRRRQGSAADKK